MITQKTILELNDRAQNTNISIYIPTHKKGEEVQQDPIRLKNMLKEIEKELAESGSNEKEIKDLLKEPRQLLEDNEFWQHNEVGLAIFITSGYFEYFRVPINFEERYLVDEHFLITPLVRMLSLEGTFCILALSQKNVRFIRATRNSLRMEELENAPQSMEEFQKYDVNQRSLQHHSGQGAGQAIFHGQGAGGDKSDVMVEEYLKTIENEVTSFMRKLNDPLILAGTNEAVAHYRKINHYDRLMETAITANPDPKANEELRDEAWEIISSYFLQDMHNDIERFEDTTGSEKHSEDLDSIVEGAWFGKVDSLFIPIGACKWGWFDEQNDAVHHSDAKTNGEHDLYNLVAIKTLKQGGNVYALKEEEMPNNASIAALFRYP